jgi:hypothetical protein
MPQGSIYVFVISLVCTASETFTFIKLFQIYAYLIFPPFINLCAVSRTAGC